MGYFNEIKKAWNRFIIICFLLGLGGFAKGNNNLFSGEGSENEYKVIGNENPIVIPLAQPIPEDDFVGGSGSLFVHDLTGNGQMEIIVTSKGHIGAYDLSGEVIWVRETDIYLFEFYHHPGVIAGDLDGDGEEEIAYLNPRREIVFLTGSSGAEEKILSDVGDPYAMAIANLRGQGDRDIVLQYSQTHLRAIRAEDGSEIWETHDYRGIDHSPLRQADIDGDGLDEIAGAAIINHDGTKMNAWDLGGAYRSMDSYVIADIVPGYPLEIALAEQRGANSHTVVVNPEKIVFNALNPWNWEDPDKVAVGNFAPEYPGLEVFNRSSGGDGTTPRGNKEPYRHEQAPWILDASGELIEKYYLNDNKPDGWTGSGLEEICRIDWYGDGKDYLVGKERHKDGDWAIVDAITGKFKTTFSAKTRLIYAADVLGDYREEVFIIDVDGTIKIFRNDTEPKITNKPRYWEQQHYRRQKQNWNYYSP